MPTVTKAAKSLPSGQPEAGVHVHTLERGAKKTKSDGAHLHVFDIGGEIVATEEDGPHDHDLPQEAANKTTVGGGHEHKIVVGDGDLVTKSGGNHDHEALVAHTSFDGYHFHKLTLPDGTEISSLSPGEFWVRAGKPDQSGLPPAPPASRLAKKNGPLPDAGLVLSVPMAEAVIAGRKKKILKSRKFNLEGRTLVLLGDGLAFGTITLGKAEKATADNVRTSASEHLISGHEFQELRKQRSWQSEPYWLWPVEDVVAFDRPRQTNVKKTSAQAIVSTVKLEDEVAAVVDLDDDSAASLRDAQSLAKSMATESQGFVDRNIRFFEGGDEFLAALPSLIKKLSAKIRTVDVGEIQKRDNTTSFVDTGSELLTALKKIDGLPLEHEIELLERLGRVAGRFDSLDDAGPVEKASISEMMAQLTDAELAASDEKLHADYNELFADTDKTSAMGISREDLINIEIFMLEEFDHRGMDHKDDALTAEARRFMEQMNPSSEKSMQINDVLGHLKSFKLRMPFLTMVGGMADKGQSENDIDILIKGNIPQEMRDVIHLRLGRMLPPELSSKIHMLNDDLGGPISNHVELADLVVEMRPSFELKQMALTKQGDPLLELPEKRGPRRAVLQNHHKGKSIHSDLRLQVGDSLVGWTLSTQVAGAIKEPVDDVAGARQIAATFDVEGGKFNKSILAPSRARSFAKKAQPLVWLNVDGEVFGEGEVGATRSEKGVIVAVDKPMVEFGTQTGSFHEYFFSKGKHLTGTMFFRKLTGTAGSSQADVDAGRATRAGESFWTVFLSKDLLPSILKSSLSERMPPDGFSWIPVSLEKVTPKEFRYWESKGAEAREMRNALVVSKFFTADNIKIVNGEFRRTVQKTYVYEASEKDEYGDGKKKKPRRKMDPQDSEWFVDEDTEKKLNSKQQASLDRENELIRENSKKPEASKAHKFDVAIWTHPNGHPRCKVCGDEETMSGVCNAPERLEMAVNNAFGKKETSIDDGEDSLKQWDANLAAAREEVLARDAWKEYGALKASMLGMVMARKNLPIIKTAEERFVLGVVLEPNDGAGGAPFDPDAQDDIYSAAAVRETAHLFMEEFGHLGLMHREIVTGKLKILESYIAPTDFEINGQTVRKGTWLLAIRVLCDKIWKDIKEGKLNGFSIGGSARRSPPIKRPAAA